MLARSRCAPRSWWGTIYEFICFESSQMMMMMMMMMMGRAWQRVCNIVVKPPVLLGERIPLYWSSPNLLSIWWFQSPRRTWLTDWIPRICIHQDHHSDGNLKPQPTRISALFVLLQSLVWMVKSRKTYLLRCGRVVQKSPQTSSSASDRRSHPSTAQRMHVRSSAKG